MVFSCAGADPTYATFLSPAGRGRRGDGAAQLRRDLCACAITSPGRCSDRGRGAIVLVSSGAGLVGGPNMVAYGATKAFDMVMAEALWAELHGAGVDVLGLVLGLTDTPALRRLLLQRGQIAAVRRPDSRCGDRRAGRRAPRSPTCRTARRASPATTSGWVTRRSEAMSRNDAVRMLLQVAGGVMGNDEEVRG